jgi:hypothetical protein
MLLVQLGINSTSDVWKFCQKLDEPPGRVQQIGLAPHDYLYLLYLKHVQTSSVWLLKIYAKTTKYILLDQ